MKKSEIRGNLKDLHPCIINTDMAKFFFFKHVGQHFISYMKAYPFFFCFERIAQQEDNIICIATILGRNIEFGLG